MPKVDSGTSIDFQSSKRGQRVFQILYGWVVSYKVMQQLPRLQVFSKEMVVDGIQYVIVIAGNKDDSLKLQNNGRVYPIEKIRKDSNGIRLWEIWIGKVASVNK